MPTISINRVYVDKLKQLGVYDKWVSNLKDQWCYLTKCFLNPDSNGHEDYISHCVEHIAFHLFIDYSFCWEDTPEGHTFWHDIAKSIKN
jgi:hypothetical protein